MSADPWGNDSDPFNSDEDLAGPLRTSEASANSITKRHVLLAAGSVAVAVLALVLSIADSNGYGTVGLCAFAYVLAVLADMEARRSRYDRAVYARPLGMVCLRIAVFAATVWVGWQAAVSLAGSW